MSNLDFRNLAPVNSCFIGIIGLGYVGLPLTLEFAKTKKCLRTQKSLRRKVIGFDLNHKRIEAFWQCEWEKVGLFSIFAPV